MNLTELCSAYVEAEAELCRDWDRWCAEGVRRLREVGGEATTKPDAKGYVVLYMADEKTFASTIDQIPRHTDVGEWIRAEEKRLRAQGGEVAKLREELERRLAIAPNLLPAFARAWLREQAAKP